MIVELFVPWGGTAEERPGRSRQMQFVYSSLLAQMFSDWVCGLATVSRELVFSKSRAINLAAAESKADVIVFNDADSLVPPYSLRRAVQVAAETRGFVRAFDRYTMLTAEQTEKLIEGRDWRAAFDLPVLREQPDPVSHGVAAFWRERFVELGGYDPRLLRWYDDLAFESVCSASGIEFQPNQPGRLIHLEHAERQVPDSDTALWQRYQTEDPLLVRREAGFPL